MFLDGQVDEAVKNQSSGDTFSTLTRKINILILCTFLKHLNIWDNLCKLESNVIVFLVFLAASLPARPPPHPAPRLNLKATSSCFQSLNNVVDVAELEFRMCSMYLLEEAAVWGLSLVFCYCEKSFETLIRSYFLNRILSNIHRISFMT